MDMPDDWDVSLLVREFRFKNVQTHYSCWCTPWLWASAMNSRQCAEKQRHYCANEGPYSQGYGLPRDHIQMWELDPTEGWAPEFWCLQTVVLVKTPESSLDCKEIKPVNPQGIQPWVHIVRTDAEAEAPILWPLDAKSRHWKRLWCWERLKAGGEGGDRGWDGWVASPMQWIWTWETFRRWWPIFSRVVEIFSLNF